METSDSRDCGDVPALAAPARPAQGVDRGDRVHEFRGESVTVTWSRQRCIHAASCVMNLPRVFEPGRRPWIDLTGTPADVIARVVAHCPTGSLHFERTDGGEPEAAPDTNLARVTRDGPIYLHGAIELLDESGALRLADTRVALCRCGRSSNKPLCDGAHLTGFRDLGALSPENQLQDRGLRGGTLRVRPEPNGPLEIEGAFTIASADRRTMLQGSRARLCRCGNSRTKPFCDGSHQHVGFVSG
jgi:CDGSH-type Zn-finger protein/uncharacterized Fe-S cluster protein YjdI